MLAHLCDGRPGRVRSNMKTRRPAKKNRARIDGIDFPEQRSRDRQFTGSRRQHQQDQPHHRGHLHRAVLDRRRRFAHDRALRQERRLVVAAHRAIFFEDSGRCAGFRGTGDRNRRHYCRLSFRAYQSDACRQQSANLSRLRQRVRIGDQQLHRERRLVARYARQYSLSHPRSAANRAG